MILRPPSVETADVLSTGYMLEVAGTRYDLSAPERGDASLEEDAVGMEAHPDGHVSISFGLLPNELQALKAQVGETGRVLTPSGKTLFAVRIERVVPELNVLIGIPLKDDPRDALVPAYP